MHRRLEELVAGFDLSTYRENTFEQVFCAELLQAAWLAGRPPLEIDRPFVDFAGYDLVVTCGAVTRHVQLKATAGQITVHRALATKPSGGVVNFKPTTRGSPTAASGRPSASSHLVVPVSHFTCNLAPVSGLVRPGAGGLTKGPARVNL